MVTRKVNNIKILKFSKGEYVRKSKNREVFSKRYTSNWSNNMFKIPKLNFTNSKTCQSGQNMQCAFYTE